MVARRAKKILVVVVVAVLAATVVHRPEEHAARCGDPVDWDDSLLAEKAKPLGWALDDADEPGDSDGHGWTSCVTEKE